MFRGEHSLSMDPKGRVAVPSRYRERLAESCGGKLVVTISLMERCLAVYPFPDWQTIEDDLRELPALDKKAQAISHLLIGHASECDMDSHGRLLIPQTLREFAGSGQADQDAGSSPQVRAVVRYGVGHKT